LASDRPARPRRRRWTPYLRRFGTLIGFVGIVVFFWANNPDTFMTARNWLNISQQISMLAVVAFTMTIVMVMNDFDLSVGSMASLAGVVAAVLFAAGQPIWVGVGAAWCRTAKPCSGATSRPPSAVLPAAGWRSAAPTAERCCCRT
jgi:ribose/xylose/arabinose/galactoside ABC-type transport system permease subunit